MTAKFNFVLPDDLLERLKSVASQKNVSVASILNTLISEHVDGADRISAIEKRVAELEKELALLKNKT